MEGYICIYLTRFLATESCMQIFIFLKRSQINCVACLPNIFHCFFFSTENVSKKHRAKGNTVFKPMHLPWPCPFSATETLSLVPTSNSPYPEVMLSVVKEKPHFPVSMRKKHLLQRNDIWMLELPQQLQNKESPQQLYPHIQSCERAGKMNALIVFATYSTIQTRKAEICKSRKTALFFFHERTSH